MAERRITGPVNDPGRGTPQATQAAIEAETNEDTYLPPDLLAHSPGVAKVWVKWEQSGAHGMFVSYNMTSVTDGGAVGDTDHLWNVDFSSTQWALVATSDGGIMPTLEGGTNAAGGCKTISRVNSTAAAIDSGANSMAIFGTRV